MKRYICTENSVYDDNDEFNVSFSNSDLKKIENRIVSEIEQKYGRKYRNLNIKINNSEIVSPNTICITFSVDKTPNAGVYNKVFDFTAWDSYFDSIDFETHLNRSILKFVATLFD